jgi:hypothetical protein
MHTHEFLTVGVRKRDGPVMMFAATSLARLKILWQ